MRKEEMEKLAKEEHLASWKPKTKLGADVKSGKITDIEQIFEKSMKILEPEIVDILIPDLRSDLLLIGQAKGKFGGGKARFWRQTQRKTAEGNVPAFACMIVIGDGKGHLGIGLGKARETLPAKGKAMREAKLNLIKVARGCGSFDCSCKETHSIPYKVRGKISSSVMQLYPAPKGTGLAIENECKKILRLAGIKDVYSRTFGQTRTKINLAWACYEALKNTMEIKK
jgi:small subunit ribosomal protein S5